MTDPAAAGRALAALRRVGEQRCTVCGKPFTGTVRAAYCSHACRKRAYRARARRAG